MCCFIFLCDFFHCTACAFDTVFIKLLTYLGPILQVNSAMVNTTSYLCRRLRLLLLVVQSQQPWVVFSCWCSRQRRFVVRLNFYSISHPACVGCRDDVMQFSGEAYSAPQTLYLMGRGLAAPSHHLASASSYTGLINIPALLPAKNPTPALDPSCLVSTGLRIFLG